MLPITTASTGNRFRKIRCEQFLLDFIVGAQVLNCKIAGFEIMDPAGPFLMFVTQAIFSQAVQQPLARFGSASKDVDDIAVILFGAIRASATALISAANVGLELGNE